jgi:hypothetical protein
MMARDDLDELFIDLPPQDSIRTIALEVISTQETSSSCSAETSCGHINDLASELEQVRSAAFQAMMMSSELGLMLRFLQRGMESTDFSSLAKALFDVLDAMSLKGSLHIFYDHSSDIHVDDGKMRQIEIEVFELCRGGQRIIDFGAHTIFNHTNCSLLIRNMPLHDLDRYGMLRDNLCILLDVVQNRVNSLMLEQKTQSMNQLMDISLSVIQNILLEMDSHQREFTNNTSLAIEDMLLQLKTDFSALNLDQREEDKLMVNFEAGSEKLNDMFKQAERANVLVRTVLEGLVSSLSKPSG